MCHVPLVCEGEKHLLRLELIVASTFATTEMRNIFSVLSGTLTLLFILGNVLSCFFLFFYKFSMQI